MILVLQNHDFGGSTGMHWTTPTPNTPNLPEVEAETPVDELRRRTRTTQSEVPMDT